jgi:hypothetical protein
MKKEEGWEIISYTDKHKLESTTDAMVEERHQT